MAGSVNKTIVVGSVKTVTNYAAIILALGIAIALVVSAVQRRDFRLKGLGFEVSSSTPAQANHRLDGLDLNGAPTAKPLDHDRLQREDDSGREAGRE